MTASAERAALAATGRDLMAARGGAGERRAAGISGPAAAAPITRFEDVAMVPDWLRWDATRRGALARAVGLIALAPVLATSIDGDWLGSVERLVGEDALDWAIDIGSARPGSGGTMPMIAADRMEATGLETLRASLPDVLKSCIGAPSGGAALALDRADLVEAVRFVAGPEA